MSVHPNDNTDKMIGALVASGLKQVDIARYLGISTATMHQHYKDALSRGDSRVFAMVGSKIVEACARGEPWALKLVANSRMGWSQKVDMSGQVSTGEADTSVSDMDAILDQATDEELEVINGVISRTAAGGSGSGPTTH